MPQRISPHDFTPKAKMDEPMVRSAPANHHNAARQENFFGITILA
jgi:hypothetical protein